MKNKFFLTTIFAVTLLLLGAGCQSAPQNTPVPTTVKPTPQIPVNTAPTVTPEIKPVPTPQPTPTPVTNGPKTFTFAEVAAHNSQDSCYTVINGIVYDVTSFAPNHPGGEARVLAICGKDGTSAFNQKHAGQPKPQEILNGLQIGILK